MLFFKRTKSVNRAFRSFGFSTSLYAFSLVGFDLFRNLILWSFAGAVKKFDPYDEFLKDAQLRTTLLLKPSTACYLLLRSSIAL